MTTLAKLLEGPAATIRPTIVSDTWTFKLRLLGMPYEAICHLCDDDKGKRARDHGPDTERACRTWVQQHLKREHGVPIAGEYAVKSGQEVW